MKEDILNNRNLQELNQIFLGSPRSRSNAAIKMGYESSNNITIGSIENLLSNQYSTEPYTPQMMSIMQEN